MPNTFQIESASNVSEDVEQLEEIKKFFDRATEVLSLAKTLATNTDRIVKNALAATIEDISSSDKETDLKERLIAPNSWISEISSDCAEILHHVSYALVAANELVLNNLNLYNLENKYLALGIPIHLVSKVIREMHTLSASLVSNPDINEDLDGYFEYVITRLGVQDRSTLLDRQHQSLTKLREAWLAGDPDEQTETWNCLSEAINPDSPSCSLVTI